MEEDSNGYPPSVDDSRLQALASRVLDLSRNLGNPPSPPSSPRPQPSILSNRWVSSTFVRGTQPSLFPGVSTTRMSPNRHVRIDPYGDVTLKDENEFGTVTYTVCSRTLSLASPLFRSVFEGDIPKLPLSQLAKNPKHFKSWAMDPMLRALHHQRVTGHDEAGAEKLAEFALHCHQFDCARALGPWATGWALRSKITTPDDVAMIYVTGITMDSEPIQDIAKKHAHLVGPLDWLEWPSHPVLAEIPKDKGRK